MQLTRIKLKNFRTYQDINIKIGEGLQLFIGKNDIGKSTIFEALDIYFNDKDANVKLSIDDLNVNAKKNGDYKISITCCFALDQNDEIFVETIKVDPKEEFLLNRNNEIEIKKEWDCASTLKCSTSIVCCIPQSVPSSVLTEKQADLKKRVKELKIEDSVNQTINSSMRKGIIAALTNDNTPLIEQTIQTKNLLCEKDIFDNISKSFPDFYLFKADRKNSTSDDEVQNPMAIAVKRAFEIQEVQDYIKKIQDIIEKELNNINSATITKLKEFNVDYGNNLTARTASNWSKAISNDIVDGNNIPINKRGSGIRRLLLLSYLMVEAEHKSANNNKSNIIFAIEEPETALHPTMQKVFIDKLIELSNANRIGYDNESKSIHTTNKYQILITTHLPCYVGKVKQEQIICLYKNNGNVCRYTDDDLIDFIRMEMGELPIVHYKYIIFVEGENDLNALQNFGKIKELKQIFDINSEEIHIIPLHGGNLLQCMESNYFWDLPVKQYHLYDGDNEKYKNIINDRCNTNSKPTVRGRTTKLKEMENYIPISLLETILGVDLAKYKDEWDSASFDIVDTLLNQKDTNNSTFNDIKNKVASKKKAIALKTYLSKNVLARVTKRQLEERGVYSEIEEWFKDMKALQDYSD